MATHCRARRSWHTQAQSHQDNPPSEERLGVLRALCGVKISETGQLDVEDVGFNLMPWTYLFDIRKEVAQEMHLVMGNMFGFKATQLCARKMEDKVWMACEKSPEGRWWMGKWPWTVVDQPQRPEAPRELTRHALKTW